MLDVRSLATLCSHSNILKSVGQTECNGACCYAAGLALSADPDYKLLAKAYPYMAQRLLTDPTPELRGTFEELMLQDEQFRWSRLIDLMKVRLLSVPILCFPKVFAMFPVSRTRSRLAHACRRAARA